PLANRRQIRDGDGPPAAQRVAQISQMYYGCPEANGIDAFTPHPSDEVNGLTGRTAPAPAFRLRHQPLRSPVMTEPRVPVSSRRTLLACAGAACAAALAGCARGSSGNGGMAVSQPAQGSSATGPPWASRAAAGVDQAVLGQPASGRPASGQPSSSQP